MEKILITGAAGFLGRQLSDFLEKKKIQTVDVDDLSVRPLLKPKKKLIKMKVENISEGFLKKKSIMTIVHLAAKKSVDQSFFKLSNSIENYSMTIKLLTSASKSGVKNFFNASTCEIFGYQNKKLNEKSKFIPHSPYAVSKVANEYLCDLFLMKQSKMKITSLIFFNTYGPSEGRDAVIPKFIHALNHNKPIYLEGDGKQARDFTFVDDTIFALYKIIKSKKNLRYINIGSGKSVSINTIIKKLKKYYPDMRVIRNKQRINEIKNFISDTSLLQKNFKIKNKISFEEGLYKTIKNFEF